MRNLGAKKFRQHHRFTWPFRSRISLTCALADESGFAQETKHETDAFKPNLK
jgi:hypothetical protein